MVELIAHRGASAYRPENTIEAFELALEMGARAIEFDVQQAKDGELVVVHDPDLKRTAGRPERVRELSAGDLEGAGVPTLSRVFDLAAPRATLHLELKQAQPLYRGMAERAVAMLRERALLKNVVVSSFHHPSLARVRELEPAARLGYLVGRTPRAKALAEAEGLGCESVHVSVRQADAAWVRGAHAAGMRLLVYTVNTREELERLERIGVDGVFTNHPDLREGHG